MEIGVFSKCIKDLIVDHDQVNVPGLGVFHAELMGASFSDLGNTINPPYRRMYFEKAEVGRDSGALVLDCISNCLNVTVEQAESELQWCLGRIRSELDGNRLCVLPGLGSMKATSHHDYFFVPDEGLDIYPEGLGLAPICLRQNSASRGVQEQPPKAAVCPVPVPALPEIDSTPSSSRDIREIYEERVGDGCQSRCDDTPVPASFAGNGKVTHKDEVTPGRFRQVSLAVLSIVALVIAILLLSARILPEELVDRILYTTEELQLIQENR